MASDRGAVAGAEPTSKDFAIDFGAAVMQSHACHDCPGYVAEMLSVIPKRVIDLKGKDEIVVGGCHATLVGPDLVLTAAHCLRDWVGPSQWSAMAGGDCSKAYSFYFPATRQFQFEQARCRQVVTPITFKSGSLQLEPDDAMVRLDHEVMREQALVDPAQIRDEEVIDIWGYNSDVAAYVHRACRRVTGSILTPLDRDREGAYITLTCDGSITQGCSGAGVFANGKWRGLVSCGVSETAQGAALLGSNEAVISLSYCAVTGAIPPPSSCFVDPTRKDAALHDLYLSGIDKTKEWISETEQSLERAFPYARFEYRHGPASLTPFTYTPEFVIRCVYADKLPVTGNVIAAARLDLKTFKPRYVLLNRDATVAGVTMRSRSRPSPTDNTDEFNIGLLFTWVDREQFDLSTDIPYCQ